VKWENKVKRREAGSDPAGKKEGSKGKERSSRKTQDFETEESERPTMVPSLRDKTLSGKLSGVKLIKPRSKRESLESGER